MEKITTLAELRESIRLLEIKRQNEKVLLMEQVKESYESLKPINMVKSAFKNFNMETLSTSSLLGTALGLAAGYLSKKATVGSSNNPLKQILGSVLQMGVADVVIQNSDGIKSVASQLIKSFLKKRKEASAAKAENETKAD